MSKLLTLFNEHSSDHNPFGKLINRVNFTSNITSDPLGNANGCLPTASSTFFTSFSLEYL